MMVQVIDAWQREVSMKSGLEGRNKIYTPPYDLAGLAVSMKSGLEGRNK